MHEAYNDSVRRAFLLGRFEAVQLGSDSTEIDHVVLGLLRADFPLAVRLFKTEEDARYVHVRIARELPRNARPVDLSSVPQTPFSRAANLVIGYAGIEAERQGHNLIAAEHLLIGVLREGTSVSAVVMAENGVTIEQLEAEVKQIKVRAVMGSKQMAGFRDLVAEARLGQPARLIGREREFAQLLQILSRRTRASAVLIGDAGVGKDSIVRALASRIAESDVPPDLVDRPVLAVNPLDVVQAVNATQKSTMQQNLLDMMQNGGPNLYVRGLFDLRDGMSVLASYLKHAKLQIITTGSPLSLRLRRDRQDELADLFEFVRVSPPTEDQALEILAEAKADFERSHGVTISSEAMQIAVAASGRFLRQRPLPERALDLIDDAASMVKVQSETLPPEIAQIRATLRAIAGEREVAILKHDFELAKKLSGQEQEEQDKFNMLREQFLTARQPKTVTPDDIVAVIADRTSLTVEAVRHALTMPDESNEPTVLMNQLADRIPPLRRNWVEGLFEYLATCSTGDSDHLAEAIKSVKAKLDHAG